MSYFKKLIFFIFIFLNSTDLLCKYNFSPNLEQTESIQSLEKNNIPNSLSTNYNIVAPDVNNDVKRRFTLVLQNELKDTVVQVFSEKTTFNWLEPYKSPSQAESAGSGFFINYKGKTYIISNAHVVNQSKAIYIQVPRSGKRRYKLKLVGISPERDLALLELNDSEADILKKELNKDALPNLELGDSDLIVRADKIVALGYPLGQQSLKSTTGIVSGREHINGQYFVQTTAPLNEGNSGGPSLDKTGKVVGVNTAIFKNANNVGYFIPINEVKHFLDQLESMPESTNNIPKLLHKPYLGIVFNNANENLTRFLGNPLPGGLYVVEIYKGSPLHKAGLQAGDMIYKINNFNIDNYGEMNLPWNTEDKVSIIDYVARLKIGEKIVIEYYRNGQKRKASFIFTQSQRPPIRLKYPGYEEIEWITIAGLNIMPLTLNHVALLASTFPDLIKYASSKKHMKPALIITNIMLNSPASRSRCIGVGSIISEVNNKKVTTLAELKEALNKTTGQYLTLKTTENIFLVIPVQEIIDSERELAKTYVYELSDSFLNLEKKYKGK